MIISLAIILLCQLAGEILARGSGFAIPGPVIGLLILLALMLLRERLKGVMPSAMSNGELEQTGRGLIAHLSLLFVPVGVGVVQKADVLFANGVALIAALVLSTLATLVVTVFTFLFVARLFRAGEAE